MIDQNKLLNAILTAENMATESTCISAYPLSIGSVTLHFSAVNPPKKLLVRIRPEMLDALKKAIGPLRQSSLDPNLYHTPDPNLSIAVSDKEEKGMATVIQLPYSLCMSHLWQ